ncbi:hypothetical protein LCGC14_2579170 [marine sediment metagenome]|uniref:Uncharacterized protein n=1 Tax=marine sediment metagenome TaxID=412755 RepID=A0A0F9B2S6_9ZZZZ
MTFAVMKAQVLDMVSQENYDRFDEIFVGRAVNLGNVDFIDKTEVVDSYWTETTVANQLWYLLPSANYEITRVEWYDLSATKRRTLVKKTMEEMDTEYVFDENYEENQDWHQTKGNPEVWIPRERDVIGIWPACDTSVDTVYVYGRERHTDMSADGDTSEIPTEFQIIPLYFAAAMLLRSDNDDRTAKYEKKYQEEVFLAKRTVKDRNKRMPGVWRPYTF